MNKSKVILLGTGTPNADPSRSGSAVVVIIKNQPYLIDCGPGVIRRAAAAKIDLTRLDKAFLTHLHSDHTVGYPDLILTPWVLGRNKPLSIYGPAGLKSMTNNLFRAYQADIEERLKGLEPANEDGYKVNPMEINPGVIYQNESLCVEAFLVNHGSWKAFGYKFITTDKIIVISGDTAPFHAMEQIYQNCDILIHEVYSVKGLARRPKEWQNYHKKVHTSTLELAKIASVVQPKLLVLYHQLFWGTSDEELINEIKEIYTGKVISGKDLDIFT